MKMDNAFRGLFFGMLAGNLLLSASASAAGFPISVARTNSSLHLQATTVPAGRLMWFQGSRPGAVTNLLQTDGTRVVQHDFAVTAGASAAFFRAAMLDTNLERTPIAEDYTHSVVIPTNGVIETWGGNYAGEFGNGTYPQTVTNGGTAVACWVVGATTETVNGWPGGPVPQSAETNWVSVAAGYACTLALKANGTLWAWGDNTYGQLGYTGGTTNGGDYSSPVQIGSNQLWSAVFADSRSSFAIRNDGTLWAWGANGYSTLGLGPAYTNIGTVWVPTQVGTASNWVKVASFSGHFSVGIQSDGSLWAWGGTDLPSSVRAGYVNTNFSVITTSPAPVNIPGPWVDVTIHAMRSGIVALKADGSLWATPAWSSNGASEWANYFSFVRAQEQDPGSMYNMLVNLGLSPSDAMAYAAATLLSYSDPLLNLADLTAANWAAMLQATSDASFLQSYSARSGWIMVRGGNALNRDGTIWLLGGSTFGSPKDGDWQPLNSDTDWGFISSGSFAAKKDGSVWSWDGLANDPVRFAGDMVQVAASIQWQSVKKTLTDVVALDTQSNLWVWGENGVGQLGLGDYQSRLAPTQLPLSGPWLDYAATSSATFAIRQGGELWAWGDFNYTKTNVARPVRLNPERPWRAVFAHNIDGLITTQGKAYALAQDGTLWAIGHNSNLGLSDTNSTVIAALQQLSGTNWAWVSPSSDHALALKSDGSLWGWGGRTYGYNTGGEFGLEYYTNTIFTVPTAIPGATWSSVSVSASESGQWDGVDGFGIHTDGTLWSWGEENFWCQLGNTSLEALQNVAYWDCTHNHGGALVFVSGFPTLSPVQVGADNDWKSVRNSGTEADAFGYSNSNPNYGVTEYTLGLKTNGTLWVWGKSPFASVANQQVYLTPANHPYPNVPYPQYSPAIPIPQQVGTNRWSYVDIEAAVTTRGELYMWGGNDGGQLLQPPGWLPRPVQGNFVCRLPSAPP